MLILTVLQGPDKGRRFELPDDLPQIIGRSSEALPLADQTISRRHAELTPNDGQWYVNDLNSSNGTFVNGVRVTARVPLSPGDQIRTGSTLLLFGVEAAQLRRRSVRMEDSGRFDAAVETTFGSSDESMIMAVPDPNQGSVLQLRAIYEMTQLIGSTADRQELLDRIMQLVFDYFQADRGFILLMNSPDDPPDPVVVRHRRKPVDREEARLTISKTIIQHVLTQSEGVLSSNAMTDKRFASGDSVQSYGIRSALCVPIKYKDQLFGVIHLDSQVVNYTFTEDQLKLLTAFGVHTGLALANEKLYAERLQRERLAAVGQTVASLSHSIRNILQGLRGGAEVVELGLRRDNAKLLRNGWEVVSRNLDRIYELTMNMLTYSKQRRPEYEMTAINPLLEEIVELQQSRFDAKKVALLTDLDADMPLVPVDPGAVHQAVLNLITNALEAVDPEDGAVTLTSAYDHEHHAVRITVGDNGHGITPETRKRLFEPFHSTKGIRGTGLGLVVIKKVVEEHGGSVEVQSTPDEGATFILTIPVQEGAGLGPDDTHGP